LVSEGTKMKFTKDQLFSSQGLTLKQLEEEQLSN
jgi:hypothetical protein